jgi:hypothetical protein
MSDSRSPKDGTFVLASGQEHTFSPYTAQLMREHQLRKAANPGANRSSLLDKSDSITQFGKGINALAQRNNPAARSPVTTTGNTSSPQPIILAGETPQLIAELTASISSYLEYLQEKDSNDRIIRKITAANILYQAIQTNDIKHFQVVLAEQEDIIKHHRSSSALETVFASNGSDFVNELKKILQDYDVPPCYEQVTKNISDMLKEYQHHLDKKLCEDGGMQDRVLIEKHRINTELRSQLSTHGINHFESQWRLNEKKLGEARAKSYIKKKISHFFKSVGQIHVDKMNAYLIEIAKRNLTHEALYTLTSNSTRR